MFNIKGQMGSAIRVCLLIGAIATNAIADDGAVKGYQTYEAFTQNVKQLAERPFLSAKSLGKTLGGRDVWLLTIGSDKPHQKPAILIMGATRATHLLGSELAIRLADHLSKPTPANTKLLSDVTLYIIPRPSPDASEHFFAKIKSLRNTNIRPTDDDGDGDIDEDGPDDLNKDGHITMMRIADITGQWMPHPNDPRIMIKADPKKDPPGPRYNLLTEGFDNDKDKQINEDAKGGVAFDHNFTFNYGYFKPGAGPHQVSEVESRAVVDFIFPKTNIAAVYAFSPEDNLLHPWKPNANAEKKRIKTTLLNADAHDQNLVVNAFKKAVGGSNAPSPANLQGSFVRWSYFHYGRPTFASRAWWIPKVETKKPAPGKDNGQNTGDKPDPKDNVSSKEKEKSKSKKTDPRSADQLNALRWFKREKINGFVNWTPVKHPDFPDKKVEVGGFIPYLRSNPPAKEIDAIAKRHTTFIRNLAAMFPRITFAQVKIKSLGSGIYRITAIIRNDGKLSTMSQMGRISRILQPCQVAIELPETAKFLKGHPRVQLSPIPGNGGLSERQWLVRTNAKSITIKAYSPIAVSITKTLELK